MFACPPGSRRPVFHHHPDLTGFYPIARLLAARRCPKEVESSPNGPLPRTADRNLLTRWKSQLEQEGAVAFRRNGQQTEKDAEIKRLRRELTVARQERDSPRKAAAYFANAKN